MQLVSLYRREMTKLFRSLRCRPTLERLEDKLAPATFTVGNTFDAGPGSLRQAILDANANPGADTVAFAIPGAGVHTIFLADQMIVTGPVTIDGYSQPGASPNTLAIGDNAVLNIEIDGSFAPPITAALIFNGGGGSTVRGLVINHLNAYAFDTGPGFGFPSSGNTIAGNFIGTDATGSAYIAGSNNGIFLEGVGNTIGGPDPADRNVIVAGFSGTGRMITFDGDTRDHTIQGNYFGVNAAGTAALNAGNPTQGMFPGSSSKGGNTIEDNVIVTSDFAIQLDSSNNRVQDNLIGTNATGTVGLGAGRGIVIRADALETANNTITGNLISGGTVGIQITATSPSSPGLVIRGNKIGTDINGTAAIPNSSDGIQISGPGGATIGGTDPGDGNIIAFNGGVGVILFNAETDGYAILGNSIFANGGLGIDLGDGNIQDGATHVNPNDTGDPDAGPNQDQNFPLLTSATAGSSTTITGTLNSTPNTTFRIEFFASDAFDPSGFGEGKSFLGFTNVTTNAVGDVSFNVNFATAGGHVITATATDPGGNTSEFSHFVLAANAFIVTNTNDDGPGSLRQAMLDAESSANVTVAIPDEIHFAIPGAGVHTIRPSQSFPVIADPVIIDGYTQPGASPNTLSVGDNAVLQIEIDCSAVSNGPFFFGDGDGSTVRGLCINNNPIDYAITIGPGFTGRASHITIAGNFVGTDPTGMTFKAGLGGGIFLGQGAGETIGGPTPADRNVIVCRSSTQGPMLTFSFGTQDNIIQGNYIGINAAGTAALNGGFTTTGMFPGDGTLIENNVIVANNIAIRLGSSNNVIRNNRIGTNAAGTAGLGGGIGIDATSQADHSANNTIEGNLISGGTAGIRIGFSEPGTVIRGNKIGTDIAGTAAIPNSGNGITIQGAFALAGTIGGTGPAEGNVIAFNGGAGIFHDGVGTYTISGNSIFSNGGLGIDLSVTANPPDGVTPNDPGDPDTGPNNFQNYPVLTSAIAASNTTISGTLNSTPNTAFRVEFFASDAADPTGFGEGQTFLGAITTDPTDANGDVSFSVTLPAAVAPGQVVTATATDPAGNTSEFSQAVAASSGDVIIDANTPQSFLDSLTVIHGNLIMVNVAGRIDLILPHLTRVDGDVIVTGNPDLTVLDAPLLASVGGQVDMSDNPALTDLNLGSLNNVGGDLSINGDTATTTVDVGSLTTVGGSLSINGDTATTTVDVSSLTTVGGSLSISGDTATTTVDVGSLTTVGGSLSISGDTATTTVDVGSLTTVAGSLSISGDTATTTVDVSSLTTLGGDVDVSGNTHMTALSIGHAKSVGGSVNVNGDTAATDIDLSSITTIGGAINVNGNTAATDIDLSGISTIGGAISVNGNTAATDIDLSSITAVGGSVSVNGDTAATGVDLSSIASVGGDESVQAQNSVTSGTANGNTVVKLFTADAQMTAALAHGTFAGPVKFTVTRLDPAALPPEPGQDSTGGAATIDPLAAYKFNFAIPTLGQNAALTFEINVAALSAADRGAFLAALADGRATVAVKNDAPGSVFRAYAVAAAGQPPDATHVTVIRLDANHNPLPAGSTATPAFVRFEGITGHFSTFGVVTVSGARQPTIPLVVASADAGGGPHVKVFDALTGNLLSSFFAFDQHFAGGVRVAVGDINGDGQRDIIVAAGQGGGPHVKVIDGTKLGQVLPGGQIADSALLANFFAYDASFRGGLYVAAGDVNGDGKADIITGAGVGGGPHVKVFSGFDGSVLDSFFAYGGHFHGEVRVAAGDVNGDGHADIVTGTGQGGGPQVVVFDGTNVAHVLLNFFAFDAAYAGGVYVGAGDIDGDHKADLVISQGGSGPEAHVRKYGATGNLQADFLPFPGNPPAHDVRVALTDRDGDGLADIVASQGNGRPPAVRSFKGTTLALESEFDAFDPTFHGGVFVG